jgi:hypothetical protein
VIELQQENIMKLTTGWQNHMRVFLILSVLFSSGCVSVDLHKSDPVTRSSVVIFQKPKAPFENHSSESMDQLWMHKSNGNTIGYSSSCNDPQDPPVEELRRRALAGFEKQKTLKQEYIPFLGRQAFHTVTEGQVDGVSVSAELLIFKKNFCSYVLAYTGVSKNLSASQKEFDSFKQNFEVP